MDAGGIKLMILPKMAALWAIAFKEIIANKIIVLTEWSCNMKHKVETYLHPNKIYKWVMVVELLVWILGLGKN